MPPKAHIFRIKADVGPPDVLRSLQHVCAHDSQREHEPDFEFDWIKRRIALMANSPSGLAAVAERFTERMGKLGAPEDAFLPGVVIEEDGRYTQPYGAALHDAATFGELIGKSLVEMGLRGVKVFDAVTHCDVIIRQTAMSESMSYGDFIAEFPLPPYIKIYDLGIGPMPSLETGGKAAPGAVKKTAKKKKKKKR